MRPRLVFACGIAGAMLFAMTGLEAQTNCSMPERENAKKELVDLETRWLHAEDNPEVQSDILATDFVHVLPSGIITKGEQIGYLRRHPPQGSPEPKHFQDLQVRVYGNVGIVNGAVLRGEGAAARRTLFTDVFVYREGNWQAVNAQELIEERGR